MFETEQVLPFGEITVSRCLHSRFFGTTCKEQRSVVCWFSFRDLQRNLVLRDLDLMM